MWLGREGGGREGTGYTGWVSRSVGRLVSL